MELLLQAGIHLIKKVITFVIYGRSVQVFKACTLFYFFSAEFFFSQIFLRGKVLGSPDKLGGKILNFPEKVIPLCHE